MAEFTQDLLAPGVAGIDLLHPNDLAPKTKLTRMRNVSRIEEGALTARPGLTSLATAGVDHHSVTRVNDGGSFTRVWGIDEDLYVGQSGGLSQVDSGYSGRPLSMLPYRPPISADPWVFVGDDNRMRKVRRDGVNLPLGLSAPGAAVSTSLATELKTAIETFNEAGGWNPNPGTGGPFASAVAEPGKVGNCVTFGVQTQSAEMGSVPFYSYFGKGFGATVNLGLVGGQPASDDDIIHLWARFVFPEVISEIKIYLVVSSDFDSAWLPGTKNDEGTVRNPDSYVKALRPSDFGPFILPDFGAFYPAIPSAERRVGNKRTEDDLDRQDDARGGAVELRRQMREGARIRADQVITPKAAWTELGVTGVPLRRGDFLRVGTNEARDWKTVTGMFVLIEATGTPPPVDQNPPGVLFAACSLDDMYLVGGRGPDTIDPGQQQYDYRAINVDIVTGALSNPSPIQSEAAWKDARRQGITVDPAAYADPDYPAGQLGNIRQEIFRRGGSLVEDWYFVGRNTTNGGTLFDTLTDAALVAARTVELDNDQPITTVDDGGNPLLAVPLPTIWGPIQNLLLGCGDPNRPGDVYWCKPGFPDSWPPGNHAEVTSPSDPLMAGWYSAGRSCVFSTEHLHDLLIDLTGNGVVTPIPTQCSRGLLGRRGLVVHRGLCYFVAKDGVFRTAGGPEEDITQDLWPLFHADDEITANGKNGFFPIDRDFPDAIRLASFDDEVWVSFRDVMGTIVWWVYSSTWGFWKPYEFRRNVTNAQEDDGARVLVLGSTSGESFEFTGSEDDGLPIQCGFRTPCLDQGVPRDYKLYGDMVIDIDRQQGSVAVQALMDNESRQGIVVLVNAESPEQFSTALGGRQRYTLDLFGTGPAATNRARNVCFDVSWESSAASKPKVFVLGPSYIIQPDATIYRPTDWDFGGRLTDKWIKGIALEVDTFGRTKLVNVEADGQVVTQIPVTTNGRRVVQFAFPQQMGRLMRLHPSTSTAGVPWFLYKFDWIFDEEPLQLARWETQELSYGIPGWKYPLFAWITIRAGAQVLFTLQAYREAGSPIPTDNPFPYIIAPTGPTKRAVYIPFDAMKGLLFKHTFESAAPFHLFREESTLVVQPWAGDMALERRPFGNDDLDLVRGMQSARLTAAKGGGG